MQLHDNTIRVSAVVQEPREGRSNPHLVSEKFAVIAAEIGNPKGKCWIDVVGNGAVVSKIAALSPGVAFNVTGRLDSNKGSDGRWRTRIWADDIQTDDGQTTLDEETS